LFAQQVASEPEVFGILPDKPASVLKMETEESEEGIVDKKSK
jgi:hypothetical protein